MYRGLCIKAFVCKSVCLYKLLPVTESVCNRVPVKREKKRTEREKKQRCREREKQKPGTTNSKKTLTKNEINDTPFFFLGGTPAIKVASVLAAGYTRTPSMGSLSRNHAPGPVEKLQVLFACAHPRPPFPRDSYLTPKAGGAA